MVKAHALFTTVFLTATVATTAFAHNEEIVSCVQAVERLYAEMGNKVKTSSPFVDVTDVPTAKVTGHEPGLHGGRRMRVERVGATWNSTAQNRHDPQGDPRWFNETIGPDAAQFFGFKILNDQEVLVPDQKEFAGAIEKVSAELVRQGKEPIAIGFYGTADTNTTSVTDYTTRFMRDRQLPIAPTGNHFLHDMSYHSGAIFMPKRLVDYVSGRQEYHFEFLKFLEEKYKDAPAEVKKAVKYYGTRIKLRDVSKIDLGTGLLTPGIIHYARNPDGNPQMSLSMSVGAFLGSESAADRMRLFIQDGFQVSISRVSEESMEPYFKSLSKEQMLADFEAFHAQYVSHASGFNPNNDLKRTQEEVCLEITQRRIAIREAALKLLGAQR